MSTIGFIVLSKRPARPDSLNFEYGVAGSIWPDREPVENHRGYCEAKAAEKPGRYRDVTYVVAEVREVES